MAHGGVSASANEKIIWIRSFLVFPAPALHKEMNVKKKMRKALKLFKRCNWQRQQFCCNLRGYEDERNKYENLVICNDGAIQNMDVMKSEVWTRRHLASCTLTSELAGNDIIKAILLGAECWEKINVCITQKIAEPLKFILLELPVLYTSDRYWQKCNLLEIKKKGKNSN